MPAYTPDTIAVGIIAEGRRTRQREGQRDHPAISDKGIKQALACGLVESNLAMYANEGDPDSLRFPHDKLSRDKNSVGVFQQRMPWWGTVEDRMDVAKSAALFYNSLVKQRIDGQDYNTDATTPGMWVAMVQQCREDLRGKYDERWAEATRIFDNLQAGAMSPEQGGTPTPTIPSRPDFQELEMWSSGSSSRSRPPINFLLHTQEGSPDATARDLAVFCDGSNNVSYHYTIRDRIVYDLVDTDRYSWSVLSANVFTINLCFAGSTVRQSRQEWLDKFGPDIEIAAYLAVQDAHKYGFSTQVIAPPYKQGPGISDHKYVTQCLHIGTHVDVGDNFPWDVLTLHVNKYAGLGPVQLPPHQPPMGDDDYMAKVPQQQWNEVHAVITQKRPSRSIYRSGNDPVGDFADLTANVDAMEHQELVERLAVQYNDSDAIERVVNVAAGQGADPTDTWAQIHAKDVLHKIDPDVLGAWLENQGKKT